MRSRTAQLVFFMIVQVSVLAMADPPETTFNDDGGWCWFEDERAIVHDGKLVIGSVAAGIHDASRRGNVEVVTYDFRGGAIKRSVLSRSFELDDHDSPAFSALADGRLLAMYSKHGRDNRIHYRITKDPSDTSTWESERTFVPSDASRVTYSNLLRLDAAHGGRGRLFNYYRGYDNSFKPSWMTSDDDGRSWTAHGLWVDFPATQRHRPYIKYTTNGTDTIHFVFTEGHPRDFSNSLYHAYFRNGVFYRSDGTRVKAVSDGPISPAEATRIFSGNEDNVAWPCDLHLDDRQRPVVVYSVQINSAHLPSGHADAGRDHRYRLAHWDGHVWLDHEIAHAGTRLYRGEDDYTGLICLNPNNTDTVYLSSDVNIESGEPNGSGHYEIYQGTTQDAGRTWTWSAITKGSDVDNLRPIVPKSNGNGSIVLWLKGKYNSYTDYDLDVVGIVRPPIASGH